MFNNHGSSKEMAPGPRVFFFDRKSVLAMPQKKHHLQPPGKGRDDAAMRRVQCIRKNRAKVESFLDKVINYFSTKILCCKRIAAFDSHVHPTCFRQEKHD